MASTYRGEASEMETKVSAEKSRFIFFLESLNSSYFQFTLPEKLPALGVPLRSEFMLDFDKWVFANQGSYGVCPRRVVEFRWGWSLQSEGLHWGSVASFSCWSATIAVCSSAVGVDEQTINSTSNEALNLLAWWGWRNLLSLSLHPILFLWTSSHPLLPYHPISICSPIPRSKYPFYPEIGTGKFKGMVASSSLHLSLSSILPAHLIFDSTKYVLRVQLMTWVPTYPSSLWNILHFVSCRKI